METQEGTRYPRAGVVSSYGAAGVGAGNRTQVFFKNCKCFQH